MTLIPILPLHIDATMRSAFASCPRKLYNEFIFGLRPAAPSVDLHAGSCFASALESIYTDIWGERPFPLSAAIVRAHSRFIRQWGDFEIPEWKRTNKTPDRVWEAVESYMREYPPVTDHVQCYRDANGKPTFEYSFAIPLEPAVVPGQGHDCAIPDYFPLHPSGEPFIYCGRADMIGSYLGLPCVRDEKTTGGSLSTGWAEQWNLRAQFIGYTWAAKQLGLNLDTVVVRGVAIQKTQICHAEAIKIYDDGIRARWLEQLRRDLWRLRRSWDESYWDYNFGESCNAYGGCMFRDACASNSPEGHLEQFIVQRWNPLNKNPVQETAA